MNNSFKYTISAKDGITRYILWFIDIVNNWLCKFSGALCRMNAPNKYHVTFIYRVVGGW